MIKGYKYLYTFFFIVKIQVLSTFLGIRNELMIYEADIKTKKIR